MHKKYLTPTSVMDNEEAVEFELLTGLKKFRFLVNGKPSENQQLEIPYEEFAYPQFISEEAIFEELKEKIQGFFKEECEGKAILLCYSAAEELKIQKIIINNKKEFDL